MNDAEILVLLGLGALFATTVHLNRRGRGGMMPMSQRPTLSTAGNSPTFPSGTAISPTSTVCGGCNGAPATRNGGGYGS